MPKESSGQTRVVPVQRALRADILSGALEPGAPLRIAALAQAHGVSFSVVREALLRLAGEGLARALPRRGFIVAPVSRRDLVELTHVRRLVEGEAFRMAIAEGDVEWETDVMGALHRLDREFEALAEGAAPGEDWVAAHADFHRALIAGSGSGRLVDLAARLRDEAEIYRQFSLRVPSSGLRDLAAEHRRLADLALQRDAEVGVPALEAHLQATTDLLLAGYFTD